LGGECYIFSRGPDKYVVFRGSDTSIDILIDLTIESVPLLIEHVLTDDKIRVHRGFLEQMKNYKKGCIEIKVPFWEYALDGNLEVKLHSREEKT
jgi:hypothetical protein